MFAIRSVFATNLCVLLLASTALAASWPTFRLYTKSNPDAFVAVNGNISDSFFNPALETKLVIHGFTSSGASTSMTKIKTNILNQEDVNVFIVDWAQGAAGPNYLQAVANVKVCGKAVAQFLKDNNIDPKNVHCIGHSLGAHTCGFAGKVSKLKRISGMDPAGPTYNIQSADNRLDKNDADYVDIIHTDAVVGMAKAIGHKDFYPNGGRDQPGCGLLDNISRQAALIEQRGGAPSQSPLAFLSCSHGRSEQLYAESISAASACQFHSSPCDSYAIFLQNKCSSCAVKDECVIMGYHSDKSTAKDGRFYLKTSKGALGALFCQA